jgi:DNA-directed RNA polymerase subunit M/transcription elongation factor TFIIS
MSKMVNGVLISISGSVTDLTIPIKTTDVLDWIRKKYKNTSIQFQGKIEDPVKETRWLSIFASICDNEENINQHMLPPPFDEETYSGPIIVLASENNDQDDYDKSITSYVNLKADEYETLYAEWSFNNSEIEVEEEINEEINDEEDEDIVPTDDIEEEIEEEVPVKQVTHVAKHTGYKSKDIFVDCLIREKIIQNFSELFGDEALTKEFELCMLNFVSDTAIREGIDVDWNNKVFWNLYRNKASYYYENLRGMDSYVQNNEDWLTKLKNKEISVQEFVEMPATHMCPARWKATIEQIIENERKLYSKNTTASIIMWCSSCKKKSKCDYYQLQTRSADEPMTTFFTCLECDKKWKI